MKTILLLVILAFVGMALCGCKASLETGLPLPPSALEVLAKVAVVDAAKIGVTSALSPRVEQAYASGKINHTVYLAAREEESALLEDLDGLRTKALNGEPVTAQDVAAAEAKHLKPIEGLIGQYVGQLPTTQPAR